MATSVLLECGHTMRWRTDYHAPTAGERVYCYACADLRTVSGRYGEYAVQCRQCRFARTYATTTGLSYAARRHLRTYPLHVIHVEQIGTDERFDVALGRQDEGTELDRTGTLW